MLGFFAGIVEWVLGLFLKKSSPKIQDIAASNAVAQTELTQSEEANAIMEKGALARNAFDASQLQQSGADTVITAADDPVNQDPNAHFRD